MRKKIINQNSQIASPGGQAWLDVQKIALVEISSEEAAYPIESALTPDDGPGWRAAQVGAQTIRLVFDEPQKIKRISSLGIATKACDRYYWLSHAARTTGDHRTAQRSSQGAPAALWQIAIRAH